MEWGSRQEFCLRHAAEMIMYFLSRLQSSADTFGDKLHCAPMTLLILRHSPC